MPDDPDVLAAQPRRARGETDTGPFRFDVVVLPAYVGRPTRRARHRPAAVAAMRAGFARLRWPADRRVPQPAGQRAGRLVTTTTAGRRLRPAGGRGTGSRTCVSGALRRLLLLPGGVHRRIPYGSVAFIPTAHSSAPPLATMSTHVGRRPSPGLATARHVDSAVALAADSLARTAPLCPRGADRGAGRCSTTGLRADHRCNRAKARRAAPRRTIVGVTSSCRR